MGAYGPHRAHPHRHGNLLRRVAPPADGLDCYTRLLAFLVRRGLVSRLAVCSLNYECILEIAANNLGLALAYLADAPLPDNLLVYKPHGSCNFLPTAQIWNVRLLAPRNIYEGDVQPVSTADVLDRYRHGYALPPAMSLYAPGKATPVATRLIAEVRARWARWVASSGLIVTIGVRPLLADVHVWGPVLKSDAP